VREAATLDDPWSGDPFANRFQGEARVTAASGNPSAFGPGPEAPREPAAVREEASTHPYYVL